MWPFLPNRKNNETVDLAQGAHNSQINIRNRVKTGTADASDTLHSAFSRSIFAQQNKQLCHQFLNTQDDLRILGQKYPSAIAVFQRSYETNSFPDIILIPKRIDRYIWRLVGNDLA